MKIKEFLSKSKKKKILTDFLLFSPIFTYFCTMFCTMYSKQQTTLHNSHQNI